MITQKHLYSVIVIAVLASLLVFYPVFFADYAFTDEAHQLWNNKDKSNFIMFLNQGRLITGWIIEKAFGNMSSVSSIKYLRLLSFTSLIFFVMIYAVYSRKIFQQLEIDKFVWLLSVLFIPFSLSSAVYVGWASCAEIFLATAFAFLSGYVLFGKVNTSDQYIKIPFSTILRSLLLALASLFTYQTAFGFFLLPFVLYFIKAKKVKPHRALVIGVGFYLFCYLVYFLLFKYSLKFYDVPASTRAEIKIAPLEKLSFFFSYPLAQAFSFNFLYNAKSILSQAFYPVVILLWIITIYYRQAKKHIASLLLYVLYIFLLLMLIYLPLLISQENFASYRTMFALNFVVTVMLVDACLWFLKSRKTVASVSIVLAVVSGAVAVYNYQFNFSKPLEKEYRVLRAYFDANYTAQTDTVIFRRPPVHLFKNDFSVNYYTDEFGYPSTEKDWTADPLFRQFVLEKTGSRTVAEKLVVIQYPYSDETGFNTAAKNGSRLVIDLFRLYSGENKQEEKK